MINLGKRRLLCPIRPCYDWNKLILSVELVDNELSVSSKLVLSHSLIIIYGHKEDKELKVGREIIGYDNNYKYHELFKFEDFSPVLAQEFLLCFCAPLEIKENLDHLFREHSHFNSFRIELNQFEDVRIYLYRSCTNHVK